MTEIVCRAEGRTPEEVMLFLLQKEPWLGKLNAEIGLADNLEDLYAWQERGLRFCPDSTKKLNAIIRGETEYEFIW